MLSIHKRKPVTLSQADAAGQVDSSRRSRFAAVIRRLALAHPLLMAAAPILLLGAANIDQIQESELWMPLGISLAGAAGVMGLAWLALRDASKAALIATACVLVFFTYGHIFETVAATVPYKYRTLLNTGMTTAAVVALVVVAWSVTQTRRDLARPTKFLALIAVLLLGSCTWQIVREQRHYQKLVERKQRAKARKASLTVIPASHHKSETTQTKSEQSDQASDSAQDEDDHDTIVPCGPVPVGQRIPPLTEKRADRPDIYYIIPDGYARADLLAEVYDFDNSEFIAGLRQRGFYVADQSCTNYPMTFLSLASSLNMRYINADTAAIGRTNRKPVYALIKDHTVGRYLQAQGYRFVHIASTWGGTARSWIADETHTVTHPLLNQEFMSVLLRSTMLHSLAPHVAHTHLFAFDKLEEMPRNAGPTFTFVHVVAPHSPYVLDRDGHIRADIPLSLQFDKDENTGGWKNLEGYIEQLRFVNKRLLEVVDAIQSRSTHPPVIIIQADHGTATRKQDKVRYSQQLDFVHERMPILNAYCVPEKCRQSLYPSISPVNSFRVLFNGLFDDTLEMLPDRQFFSWYGSPYDHWEVTEMFPHARRAE